MPRKMREMVGGCCVCSDERGWDENPLVYCDGQGCNVAVHQACYGIVTVPTGPWFCRKCESQERSARLRCELCPNKDGALKRTDSNSWAHVVCALYIPEVRFGNVATMEPIVLGLVPQERYQKVCYLCELQGRESRASTGACMQCNKSGCKQTFHVTCAQIAGLLCEEAGNYLDNVKYCGYCEYHYQRINRRVVKTIPAFKPVPSTAGEGHSSSDDDRDGGHGSSSSRSKSPKETTANQGRNSSLSSSPAVITSSKRGKKSNSINSSSGSSKRISIGHVVTSGSSCASAQPLSSSSTLTTTEPSPSTGEPDKGDGRSGSVSLSIRRSQNDEADANKTASSPSGECAAKSTLADQCSSTSSCSGSNAADADKKPPSVIVKFGKQDGTYYSKKQEVMPKKDKTYNKSPSTSSNHSTNCKDGGVSSATSSSVVTASPTVPSNDKMSRNMVLSTASLDRLPPPTSVFTPMPPESIKKEVLTVDLKNSQVESSLNEVSSSRNDKSQELKSFNASADYSKDMKQDITSATSTAASVSMNASSNSLRSPMSVTAPMPSVSEPKDINQISISNASSALLTDTEIKQERISRPVSPSRLTTELLNAGAIKRSASGKRLGRPPKKGTHLCADSLAPLSLTMAQQESADHSPERGGDAADEAKRRRRSPNKKLLTNGADPTSSIWMMGATLNPNSTIAKEMDVCLREEVETHNSFEPAQKSAHHGVPLPKKKGGSETGVGVNSGSGHVPSGAKGQPQTLEELLERQWEQGSQFLMEQASHFDIASLLSSLHQLKEENNDIEDSIDRLIQRRDHLLAVRARLMALSSLSLSPTTASNHTTPERAHHANLHQQHTNGPSPSSSGRSSAHVSPRNSAATVSPIRVERAATIISPRNLSLPTSSASSLISPRAVSSASSGSSAQQIQLPSPRDRLPPPLENGIDNYHHNPAILPPPPPPQQASAPPSSSALSSTLPGSTTSTNSYSISSSQAGLSSRTAHLLTNSRMPVVGCTSANSLLTVASSAVSCSVASSSSAALSHHRHSIQNTPPPPPPQVVLSMPTTSTSGITPPPMSRHSSYPAASSSLSVSSRIAGHSLPTDPRGSGNTMMRPPMLPHHAFPASGYHSSGRDHPSSSAAAHGHARLSAASTTDTTTILAMAAAQHSIRSAAAAAHLMDKR